MGKITSKITTTCGTVIQNWNVLEKKIRLILNAKMCCLILCLRILKIIYAFFVFLGDDSGYLDLETGEVDSGYLEIN